MSSMKILGLCGSLRAASVNRMALELAGSLMPPPMQLDIADIRPIPLFDADALERGMPEPVTALRERIRAAAAVVIATPEYNFSVPGVLKNAIDWISRGADQPFAGKPVAILSAAPGPVGGARVQYDLRKVLLFMNAMVLQKPEVFIAHSATKFGTDGKCSDEVTRKFVGEQMVAFRAWIEAVGRMTA